MGQINNPLNISNLALEWAAGAGVTQYGIKLNVTDTSSAAASKLMDLLLGGVSQFSVGKDGSLFVGGSGPAGVGTPTFIQLDNTYRGSVGSNIGLKLYFYKNGTETYGWGLNSSSGVEHHAGDSASPSSATPHHAFYTGGVERVRISFAGLTFIADNTYDIGASGAISPRNIYFGTSLFRGSTKVLGAQGAAVANASGGAIIDAECRTAVNALLAEVRTHGLIAT